MSGPGERMDGPAGADEAAADAATDAVTDAADRERRRRLRGFLNHLILYFVVMVVVVPVNAMTTPGTPWFLFPLVAWGAPLAVHAAYVMGWWGRRAEPGHGG